MSFPPPSNPQNSDPDEALVPENTVAGSPPPEDPPPPIDPPEGEGEESPENEEVQEKGKIARWWDENRPIVILILFILLFFFAYLFNRTFITIDSGERGVLFRIVGGTEMDYVYKEGLRVIFPLDRMYKYETRVQKVDTEFKVLSENGLTIFVDLTIRFRPQITQLPTLHKEVGPDYVERVVIPEVKAVIRTIFGSYTPDQIYASQAGILQNVSLTALGELRERFILLDGLMIREIRLPESVAAAIQSKLRQEQLFLEYEFRLDREEEEAKRKRIEAQGIAQFQKEISEGLTPEYLRFRGIEATLRLAESDNSKVVVVGGGNDGLPLILNLDSAQNFTPQASPSTATPSSLEPAQDAYPAAVPEMSGASPSALLPEFKPASIEVDPPVSEILPPLSAPEEPPPARNP